MNAPDEIIFNDRRVISHMTAREKEIYRYGYLAAGVKIAADIEALDAGWIAYQRLPENTSHVAFVHENGEVYDPERGWIDPSDILAADAKNCAYPLIERAVAAAIARGYR